MGRLVIAGTVLAVLVCGCATESLSTERSMLAADRSLLNVVPTQSVLTESLFKSDQAVMEEEAVRRILASKVNVPANAKVAIMKFSGTENAALRYYGLDYWRVEDYVKAQQGYIDTISKKLVASGRVREASPLPSLLTPHNASIPVLREAAVRLQADLLLVFRLTSDLYYEAKWFKQDEVKAYSTCEIVLLDVRTGIIPFTTIATKDRVEKKSDTDQNVSETMRRAEMGAVTDALNAACDKLTGFLAAAPK
jgi:hypothetical protein